MVEWWEAMTLVEQVLAAIGIAATVLLVIQMILMIIGAGGGADADVSADAPSDFDIPDVDLDVAGDVDIPSDIDIHIDSITPEGISDIDISTQVDMPLDAADITDIQRESSHFADTGIHLFTMQGLVAFFAVFGWSGLLMLKSDVIPGVSIALAAVFGFIAMFLIAVAMRAMLRLQSDGTLDIRNAIGKSGTVYLPIYPKRSSAGKVTVMIQERLVEMDAVTDGEEKIPTGAEVTIVGISNGNKLVVIKK